MVSPTDSSLEGSPTRHQSIRSPRSVQGLHHALRAVDRRAFLVAGDEEGDRARVIGVRADEFLGRRDHRGEPALHVGSSAAVEQAVADRRREGIAAPLFERTCRDDVGVAREAEERSPAAAARPEILDVAKAQWLDHEAERRQALRHHWLAALVGRRHRSACDQIPSQFNRLGHRRPSPLQLAARADKSGSGLYGGEDPAGK